jgi:hypothetical protein
MSRDQHEMVHTAWRYGLCPWEIAEQADLPIDTVLAKYASLDASERE